RPFRSCAVPIASPHALRPGDPLSFMTLSLASLPLRLLVCLFRRYKPLSFRLFAAELVKKTSGARRNELLCLLTVIPSFTGKKLDSFCEFVLRFRSVFGLLFFFTIGVFSV